MKFYVLLCTLTAAALILTPAITIPNGNDGKTEPASSDSDQMISVFLSEKETPLTLSVTDYLVGAVAAEMPATYDEQALMAQAVACHTYALYRRAQESIAPTSSLGGADLSDKPEVHQGYLSQEARREKWGDSFDEYEEKVHKAVEEVSTKILTYNGEPIFAAFFSLSAGQTESAQTVFGEPLTYLRSVASDADLLSPDCEQTVTLTETEFSACAEKLGVTLSDDADEWLGTQKAADSGFVEEISVGGNKISGLAFREAFSLRSPVFTVIRSESGFRIRTKGHGHLVGMSQYGANAMALDGAHWQQILLHYYSGVTISDV